MGSSSSSACSDSHQSDTLTDADSDTCIHLTPGEITRLTLQEDRAGHTHIHGYNFDMTNAPNTSSVTIITKNLRCSETFYVAVAAACKGSCPPLQQCSLKKEKDVTADNLNSCR